MATGRIFDRVEHPSSAEPRHGDANGEPLHIVGRVVENEALPSPPLFAGRGRVSGLGEWPRLFNYAPILRMTMCFGRTVVRFQTVRPLTPAPHPASPRKEA